MVELGILIYIIFIALAIVLFKKQKKVLFVICVYIFVLVTTVYSYFSDFPNKAFGTPEEAFAYLEKSQQSGESKSGEINYQDYCVMWHKSGGMRLFHKQENLWYSVPAILNKSSANFKQNNVKYNIVSYYLEQEDQILVVARIWDYNVDKKVEYTILDKQNLLQKIDDKIYYRIVEPDHQTLSLWMGNEFFTFRLPLKNELLVSTIDELIFFTKIIIVIFAIDYVVKKIRAKKQ